MISVISCSGFRTQEIQKLLCAMSERERLGTACAGFRINSGHPPLTQTRTIHALHAPELLANC